MKKNALGRGLNALLPDILQESQVRDIPLTDIDTNIAQPRQDFDEAALKELADSIREVGVLQPVLVVENKGRYRIVAGERRFRAARIAGLTAVPCIVRSFSADEQLEAALIENLQREDLNPMEEAQAIRALMDAAGYTQERVASRLGKSRPAVANVLRLLTLPDEVQDMVRQGLLSAGHARVLAGMNNPAAQKTLASRAVAEGLSVRALEQMSRQDGKKKAIKKAALPLPELSAFEDRIREAVGVRARVKGNLTRGQVVLTYSSREELESIYAAFERL
ncbi:MAG: ParB/RepB/Spo0J family partition protein [Clostridiales bacterium]|nr:ParB/RepB/Spo0J family partition protein [Clostridiales bacterium]